MTGNAHPPGLDSVLSEHVPTNCGAHMRGTSSPHASGEDPWASKSAESSREHRGMAIRAVSQFCKDALRTMVSVLSAGGFVK